MINLMTRFWFPITDDEEEGVWIDNSTGDIQTFFDWKVGEPNGLERQNCGNVVPPSNKYHYHIHMNP